MFQKLVDRIFSCTSIISNKIIVCVKFVFNKLRGIFFTKKKNEEKAFRPIMDIPKLPDLPPPRKVDKILVAHLKSELKEATGIEAKTLKNMLHYAYRGFTPKTLKDKYRFIKDARGAVYVADPQGYRLIHVA